ncbi:uncharacterized protein HD556DRAFT_1312036 [Suillus plorans]|uniref:DUF6532 domain-containing protein n=1 Tax=Suillus plorans TaxID=116603 RepID=A0A9P7DDU3_9AGAM|nr:uncharacterized protein HD556DRAFT_1312036 [Suillus plorans]KAG1788446.1 hypothetical protein HD556DRAFT_1312036 [Suillus plorans]
MLLVTAERALYQVEEQQERDGRRQGLLQNTKTSRKNQEPHSSDGSQFTAEDVPLASATVNPLSLKPWFTKVPPQPTPTSRRLSGGWSEDTLTQMPMGTCKLTAAQAKELMMLCNNNLSDNEQEEHYGDRDFIDTRDADVNDFADETTYMDRNVSDDEYSHKDAGRYLSSSDNECDMPLNCKRKCNAEDLSEDSSSPQHHDQRLPCKICKSKGRVAARDYKVAVQQLIKFAIGDFHGWLASEHAYPDRMTQVSWAKEAWKEACVSLDIEIGFNGKIIQMITCRTSHLTSEVKAKLRPLVESIYGFNCSTRESVKAKNRRLVCDLKDKFGLCYCDLGDRKSKTPRSGLFRMRLNQKGANLIWYQNKREEGIMFDKYFSPFPIPALALLYTAAECCIDEWADGKRTDISFSGGEYKEEINDTGRKHAKVDPIEVVHGDYLSDHEIEHAVQEYMQGGNDRNESDATEESDGDNKGEHE